MSRLIRLCSLLGVLGLAGFCHAQYKGLYVPGLVGMQAGTQPPPGVYLGNVLWAYPTGTIKDNNGNTVPTGDLHITSVFNVILVNWVTNLKLFGGNIAFGAGFPFVKNRVQLNSLDVNSGFAYSDTIFTPFNIGWHLKRADVQATYNLIAPTGTFAPGATNNTGLGMWANEVAVAATAYLDQKKTWSAAGSFNVEFHSSKSGEDITVGDLGTVEWGAGKTFYKKLSGPVPLVTNVGVTGYTQFKITGDSGSDIPVALRGFRDRVFALGPEANVFIPKPRLTLLFRYQPEFGARNRTQGQTFVVSIAWVAKSLVKHQP